MRNRKRSNYVHGEVPMMRYRRSMFDLSAGVKTSANVGTLYPFYVQEVYPGDTFKIKEASVIQLSSTLIKPVKDNLFIDKYFFFCPNRLVSDDWTSVMGENNSSAWAENVEHTVPQLPVGSKVESKSVADYLGLPVGRLAQPVSLLPFRAFAKIYDQWFRDENIVSPMHIQTGSWSSSEVLNTDAWAPNNYTGQLPKVSKMHDYFTCCLPAPQKGDAIGVNVSTSGGFLPLKASSSLSSFGIYPRFSVNTPSVFGNSSRNLILADYNTGVSDGGKTLFYDPSSSPSGGGSAAYAVTGSNLGVDLDADTAYVSINDLRFAIQFQKLLEKQARGGTRYCEILANEWGVSSGDARLQRTEFLGGKRSPISVTQVTSTSATNFNVDTETEDIPQGSLAGNASGLSYSRATKGFVEHGFVIGVFCIRQFHSYQQGIQRFWTRCKKTDFYNPVFANIGEQPVYKYELFGVNEAGTQDDTVFGYQEAWADLRFRPNLVTGQMRSIAANSLDLWHLADNYANAPTLVSSWLEETPDILDDRVTVNSSVQDQFLIDFYVQNIAYRALPTYSVPGLMDHY